MRLAILSDIHANREGFEAVLADLAPRAVDRIVLLGDIVGYGPDPGWCAERAAALVEAGALALRGNHDSAAAGTPENMSATARAAIDWTRARLTPAQRGFLAALPMTADLGPCRFVHASANDPAGWIYVTSDSAASGCFRVCAARAIFVGHVHRPALYSCDAGGGVRGHDFPFARPIPLLGSRRWLAVVGSVGQPRDGVPRAGWALYDSATRELTFRRVPYPAAETAAKIRRAGLPASLANRLLTGT